MSRLAAAGSALVVLLGCLALQAVPSTLGAYVGSVDNTTNTAANSTYARCTEAARAVGGALFVNPLDDGHGSTARDVATGTRQSTYLGGYTLDQPGPCPTANGRSVLFDGSTGFAQNIATNTNPQVFSVQIWFRTEPGYDRGGKLIGYGNGTGTSPSGSYDRHLYLRADGRLVFGVFPGIHLTVTSSGRYNDGAWHHVVVSLSPALTTYAGARMYVDGSLVASNIAATSAQVFNGRWRIGYDNLDTWPAAPPSYHYRGWLAYAAVFTKALTPAQVTRLYTARS